MTFRLSASMRNDLLDILAFAPDEPHVIMITWKLYIYCFMDLRRGSLLLVAEPLLR